MDKKAKIITLDHQKDRLTQSLYEKRVNSLKNARKTNVLGDVDMHSKWWNNIKKVILRLKCSKLARFLSCLRKIGTGMLVACITSAFCAIFEVFFWVLWWKNKKNMCFYCNWLDFFVFFVLFLLFLLFLLFWWRFCFFEPFCKMLCACFLRKKVIII